jgi:hypothetical protein
VYGNASATDTEDLPRWTNSDFFLEAQVGRQFCVSSDVLLNAIAQSVLPQGELGERFSTHVGVTRLPGSPTMFRK